MSSVPRAVPSAVVPTASNSVPVLSDAQLKARKAPSGSSHVPQVGKTDGGIPLPNPKFHAPRTRGRVRQSGAPGAPTVPSMNGLLFRKGPIDSHYQDQNQGSRNPYRKVNNPPTRGMYTIVASYLNGIAMSQNTDNAGWKVRRGQQRTSWMRVTLPPRANGYSPETYTPHQNPQAVRFNRIQPGVPGTDQYGTGVLNADSYGAGQTAGGVGGSNYTPAPGPPATNSTANGASSGGDMPVWG